MEGIYLVDKQTGWTSFDVVAKMRGITGIRTIGHAGTLDPFATGLLIILVGKEFTKKQSEYMKLDKEYEAVLKLGKESSTGDPEGEIRDAKELENLTRRKIEEAFEKFTGEISQTPPSHSAIKIDGVRAYKKARRGEQFTLQERKIFVNRLEIMDFKYPILEFRASCSSGTYIRTLAEDIAKELGTKGYLTELRRTKIGKYNIKNSQKMDEIEKRLRK